MIFLYVTLFGALGAMLRFLLSSMLAGTVFPIGILTVNIIGSFLLVFFTIYGGAKFKLPKDVITAMCTGLVGAFTTFSTFSLETVEMLMASRYLHAFLYVAFSIIGGFMAAGIGFWFSNKLLKRNEQEEEGELDND